MASLLSGCLPPFLQSNPAPVCSVRWESDVDSSLVRQVRADLLAAQGCDKLVVSLLSPGGNVIHGIEIIRLMEHAQRHGLTIEIHGGALVASMATMIMAAGSPGHRYVYLRAVVVVHGIQQNGDCYYPFLPPVTEREKVGAVLISILSDLLVKHTRQPANVVDSWFRCGNEQYGNGWLLVRLGMADVVE